MIELKNISKTFNVLKRRPGLKGILKDILKPERRDLNILKNINLKILDKERIGLVGKNGSGKSTLIKILCGVLRPTEGNVLFNDKDIIKDLKYYKQNLGVFWGQRFQLSNEIAFRESLELLKYVYRIDNISYKNRLEFLTDCFNLGEFLSRPLRELSLGQRVLCEAASVFLHSPRVVLLDEPTIGLDLEVKDHFFNSVNQICQNENITLFITSHSVRDIKKLSDRLLVLNNGKINIDCPTEDFISKHVKNKKAVIIYSDENGIYLKEQYIHTLILKDNNKIEIEIPVSYTINDVINTVSDVFKIIDIKIQDEDFEDVLLKLYKKSDH